MPQEPKKRHSRQRQGKRRAGISLTVPQTVTCQNCGVKHIAHAVCPNCGYYKGQQYIAVNKTAASANENSR